MGLTNIFVYKSLKKHKKRSSIPRPLCQDGPNLAIRARHRYEGLVRELIAWRFGQAMSTAKTISEMTLEDVDKEILRTTEIRLEALQRQAQRLREQQNNASSQEPASKTESIGDARLAEWPVVDSIPVWLDEYCDEPQTARQIAEGLKRAGHKFGGDDPVRTVRAAIKKAMAANPNVFQIGWAKFYLRSKSANMAKQIEKDAAKTAGTGGRSIREHSRRTKEGIAKRRREGLGNWGHPKKATPELVERAKEMLRQGITLREVSRTLNISIPALYDTGIRQRDLKREGELRKKDELPFNDLPEGSNVVRLGKG